MYVKYVNTYAMEMIHIWSNNWNLSIPLPLQFEFFCLFARGNMEEYLFVIFIQEC